MFENSEQDIAAIKINLQNLLAYKRDFIITLLLGISTSVLMIFLWTAVYSNSHATTIGGFSLQLMYTYFFMVGGIFSLANTDIDTRLGEDIEEGNIAASLLRPINYLKQLAMGSVADRIVGGIAITLPLIVIVMVFMHVSFTPINVLLFFLEVFVGAIVIDLIGFLIGTLAVYITEIWAVSSTAWTIMYLTGGGIMPLNLLPPIIKGIVFLLPFQLFAYLPTITLLGLATNAMIINGLIIGTIWAAVLVIFSYFWWHRIRKDLTSVGG